MTTPVFHGELQLAGWSESHNGGCKVTFWLAESSDLDAFRAMTVRKGNTAGQRLACALVEIGDDEQPVQQPPAPPPAEPEKPKGGPLAKLAGQWCGDREFRNWVRGAYDIIMGGNESGIGDLGKEDLLKLGLGGFARHAILVMCDIESRRELDHNAEAARKFHTLIREPFAAHLKALETAA